MFHIIKTTIVYPPKLAWNKVSYVNFCKLAQITKKLVLREIEGNTKNKCECEE